MSPKMDDIESTSWWLNHPFDKKYAQVNLIISPGIGVKIKKPLTPWPPPGLSYTPSGTPKISSTPKGSSNLQRYTLPQTNGPSTCKYEVGKLFVFEKKAYFFRCPTWVFLRACNFCNFWLPPEPPFIVQQGDAMDVTQTIWIHHAGDLKNSVEAWGWKSVFFMRWYGFRSI